jgi:hypothetical protein
MAVLAFSCLLGLAGVSHDDVLDYLTACSPLGRVTLEEPFGRATKLTPQIDHYLKIDEEGDFLNHKGWPWPPGTTISIPKSESGVRLTVHLSFARWAPFSVRALVHAVARLKRPYRGYAETVLPPNDFNLVLHVRPTHRRHAESDKQGPRKADPFLQFFP